MRIDELKFREPSLEERLHTPNGTAAVLVPLFSGEKGIEILFEIRSASVSGPGQIAFPGGHHDPVRDRDHYDTAVRETCEETGLRRSDVKGMCPGGIAFNPFGILVYSYIAGIGIHSVDELVPSAEVERFFSLPLSRLSTESFDVESVAVELGDRVGSDGGLRAGVTQGKRRRGVFSMVSIESHYGDIWGITGTLLKKALECILPA